MSMRKLKTGLSLSGRSVVAPPGPSGLLGANLSMTLHHIPLLPLCNVHDAPILPGGVEDGFRALVAYGVLAEVNEAEVAALLNERDSASCTIYPSVDFPVKFSMITLPR